MAADEFDEIKREVIRDLVAQAHAQPDCPERDAILQNVAFGHYVDMMELEHDLAHLERVVKERGL